MKRICLWSGPRNISTALMYSFGQRSDTTIVDEPLYAHYLCSTSANEYHPGSKEVLLFQENNGEKVVKKMLGDLFQTPVVFFKHMTHHLINLDRSFLKETENIILTRDPKEMITSFIKQIPNPVITDTGYPQHLELYDYLCSIGKPPLIVDSKDLLLNPKKKLTELCAYLAIPFQEGMLRWEAGPRKEDGVWAKYWYHNVHKSTGFRVYQAKNEPLPVSLMSLYEECDTIYKQLISHN